MGSQSPLTPLTPPWYYFNWIFIHKSLKNSQYMYKHFQVRKYWKLPVVIFKTNKQYFCLNPISFAKLKHNR